VLADGAGAGRSYAVHLPFVSSFADFHRPWSQLEEFVDGLQVVDVAAGGG
jgi:hypothetical protein